MPRARRVIVFLAVLVLAVLAWVVIARRAPLVSGPTGLDVIMGSPRGEVASLHSIDVVFDEPMVALGSRGNAKGKPPLRIEPEIDGSFSWIGSRALSFIPRGEVPGGTRVRCRVPKGTRSIEGHVTASDFAWEILVGRPRLVRSVPSERQAIPTDQPLYFVFTLPPARGAEEFIRITGPAGPIALRRAEPDSAALREIFRSTLTPVKARTVLALRPSEAMAPGERYTLVISPKLPFGDDAVGLADSIRVNFTTYGPPAIVQANGQERGLSLQLAGPVDPDTLHAYLVLDPPVRPFRVRSYQATDFSIEGDGFRAGQAYKVTLRRGLPSLLGARLSSDESATVVTPHLWPSLRIVPSQGYFPLGGDVAIRIEAANTDSIEIFGAWVPPSDAPARVDPRGRSRSTAKLPRVGSWRDPGAIPDSAHALQIPISRFGPPPGPGRMLQIRVRGRALYPDADGRTRVLREDGLVQITDLGLSAMTGADRSLVWVTRLSTGEPVDGAEVRVLTGGRAQPATAARSNAEGLAWLPGIDALGAARKNGVTFEVRLGDDAAWLPMAPYELGAPEGSRAAHSAFAFTDRPLYRPGETVRWVALARRTERGIVRPPSLPRLAYTIQSPNEPEFRQGTVELGPSGSGEASVDLPAGAPLGYYQISLAEGAGRDARVIGAQWFQVEEYKLPRFQARLESLEEPAVTGERVDVKGRFTYLGGGPLAGAAVRWTITRTPDWSRPELFNDFSFQDERPWAMEEEYRHGGPMRVASGEGRLDDDGAITLPVTPEIAGLTQDQHYQVEMGARDLTDRSAYDITEFAVRRASVRAGARATIARGTKEERVEFAFIVLDRDGKPAAGIPVRWTVHKRLWKTVRVRRLGGVFGYENVPQDSLAASGSARSDTTAGTFTWSPPGAGIYSFTVEATDPKGRRTSGHADAYVSGGGAEWYRYDENWVELKPDRPSYAAGDTARVLIPTPDLPVNALFVILDQGLRSARFLPHIEDSPRIAVPLEGVAPSGEWAHAILAGPRVIPQGEGARETLPYHAWGRVPLRIAPDAHRLDVSVSTDKPAYLPRDEVTLTVSLRDAAQAAAAGEATIAVVDDAIFELADASPPDPVQSFFPMRDPGSGYRDLRWELRLPAKGEKGSISPGGDGGFEGPGLRRRFTTTAFWSSRVPVPAGGRATVRFRLPDDLTRFRVRALAASGADRFGYGERTFDVRKPLQIEWSAPRFTREKDEPQVTALVRSGLERGASMRLAAVAEGARIAGPGDWKLTAAAGGTARAAVKLSEPQGGGIRLRLRAEGGGANDAVEITIPFDAPRLWEREFHAARVDSASSTAIRTTDFPLPEEGGLTVTVTPSLLSGMDEAFAYVIDYPYGCLEQYSSMLLGLAAREAAGRHLGAVPGGGDRDEKLAHALEGVSGCVTDWMIRSWPADNAAPATSYTAGYALYAATRALAEGLPVPPPLWKRLAEASAQEVRTLFDMRGGVPGGTNRLTMEAPWLLWSLSEADKLQHGEAPFLRPDDLEALLALAQPPSLESRMLLVLAAWNASARADAAGLLESRGALAASLLDEIRARHLGRTGRHVWVNPSDPAWGDGIGGSERATALFVRFLAVTTPGDPDLQAAVAWLAEQRRPMSGAWENDHVTALALDQIAHAASLLEGPPAPVAGRVAAGGIAEPFRFERRDQAFHKTIRLADLAREAGPAGQIPLSVETNGNRPVYLEATLDRARPALDAPAREEGLIVDHSYVDAKGRPLEDRLPLGEPLFVHLAVVVSREARALVIEDPLPGGVEALNLDFLNAPRISLAEGPDAKEPSPQDLPVVYRELRDRTVRLFAEFVAPGVYHVYYPAVASAAGVYRVPGVRAEFMYSPEIYGTSVPRSVRIERRK